MNASAPLPTPLPHEPDRRPIASRSSGWARATTSFLVRVGATPNTISVVGLVFACGAGAALAATNRLPDAAPLLLVVAALCIQARLLCNLFDGMVAIESGRRSAVGELFNEAPDRLSDIAILVGAGYALGSHPTLGWAAAVVAVSTAYVRALAKTAGAPNDFCGPLAKPQRMAVVTLAALFDAFVPASFAAPGAPLLIALWIVVGGGIVTVVRRLVRAGRFLSARP